ncbi:CTNA2 protein, partial [Pachycephala philippinensis]|nr:CTNA2 protein [Pachycephala philippinensis]
SQLRKAVMDHISDSFLETNVPLLVLIEAAKSGNEKEVKEYAQVFREHANKLVEVSDLIDTARFPSGTSRRGKESVRLDEILEMGAVFPFFQSPGTSPDCHDFGNTLESGLVTPSTNSLRTLRFISFNLVHVRVPQVVSNLISSASRRDFAPPVPALQSLWEERFLLNTETKKLLGASISSHLLLPVLLFRGDARSATFLFWLMYLYKPFLLFFAFPAKFSSIYIGQLNKVGSIQLASYVSLGISDYNLLQILVLINWQQSQKITAFLFSFPSSLLHPAQERHVKEIPNLSSGCVLDKPCCIKYTHAKQVIMQQWVVLFASKEIIYVGFCSPAQKMYYSSGIKFFHFRQSLIRTEKGIRWLSCLELDSHPDDFMISLQVANLACSISNNEEGVKLVRMAATQIDSLCPQVINAALTLAARPQSKVAQDNMDVFKDQWEKQVRVLTEAVDDITSVDDFLSVSENHILEDVNKCVIALQEGDVDTLDRTAGAIRGRAARVIHIINAEMENYETGVYTEKVLEATKLLSETVMPRFAEQVEVAIEALSANVPQPFEENEFIDASRLVYDGVRDIRKAVLMIRTPEELEDDSDFEQEDYDVRSRTSVQTEDDQLIAGQSARAIMAQLPQEEKAKIAEQVEIFHQEKSKLDAEVAKWDDSGNDIIVLAKQMCMIMMEMTDFTRGKGPLKNTSDVINAAKKIAEAGSRMDKLARAVADQCPDSACKQDLLAYLQRIALYCHQLNICSKVKAEVQNLGGELIVSGLDSATSLIQAAKNLMNAVVLTVKASYVASTKYQKVYGTAAVNSPVVSWKMKAPEKKPLVKREKPEEYQTRVRRGSQKKHISPVQALSEFKAMDSF